MLTFRDSIKSFKSDGDLLETMTKYDFNVGHSTPQNRKLFHEFGKKWNLILSKTDEKVTEIKTLIKFLKSLSTMVSGISKTRFLPSDPNELCDRLKSSLQQKNEWRKSEVINEEIVAIVDKLLKYKCISTKQHEQVLIKCNLLHKQVYLLV